MTIKLNNEISEKVKNGVLKASDLIAYILENTYLHFKIADIKGPLTRENVNKQLSLNKLYNDEEKTVKNAYIKNNILYLEF